MDQASRPTRGAGRAKVDQREPKRGLIRGQKEHQLFIRGKPAQKIWLVIVKGKQARVFQEFDGTEIKFPVFDSDTDYTEGNCVTRTYVYIFKPPVDALDQAFTHIPNVLQSRPEYTIVQYWSADTQKALRLRIQR